jgi:hypothetical protein
MNPKLIKTILLALAAGFFFLWILEFRRAGMAESYWLLLLSIVCSTAIKTAGGRETGS